MKYTHAHNTLYTLIVYLNFVGNKIFDFRNIVIQKIPNKY